MTSEVRHGLVAAIFEDSRQARDEAHLALRDTAAGFEWEQSPGYSFALAVSSAPHGLAESTLRAAFALRDRLAPRSVRVACDVLKGPPDPKQPEYHAALRRLDRRLRLAETKGLSVVASKALIDRLFTSAEFRFDPIPESAESVFAVSRHGAFRVDPTIGRYVVEAEIGDQGRVDAIQRYLDGGLLDLSRCPSAIDVGAAISDAKGELVVIAGDAWLGKTYCAQALNKRATRAHLTDFETPAPDWEVPGFLASSGRRLWIINAADEAERGGMPLARVFNQLPSPLPPELTVVVFTRPDGSLPALTGRGRPVRQFALLPLDPAGAMRELGLDVEEWVRVYVAARALSWPILTFAELGEIARRVREGREVDRGLRDDLLRRRCAAGRRGARPQVEEHKLFDGARLLAAIAGLSGRHSFQRGGGAGFNVVEHGQELVTAVEKLENSEVLVRAGESLQFAAAHLEEDLAASHLAEHLRRGALSATDLRTLVHDGVTVRSDVRRIVTLVEERLETSAQDELRTELEANASTLFEELRAVLRRSGEVLTWAEDAPVMRTLGTIPVRDEVGRTLSAGAYASPAEVHFALRLALMHGWETELGSIALEVALSGTQPATIRELAAEIALRWASASQRPVEPRLMALARTTTSRDEPDEPLATLRASVLDHALEHGELSASEVASLAAPPKRRLFDARVMLLQRIGEKMNASLAREVIDAARGGGPGGLHPGVVAYLHRRALRALVETAPWLPEDLPRLEQILDGGEFDAQEMLAKRLSGERETRRTLYLRRRCSRGRLDVDLVFPDDAAWLVETIVGSQPPPESVRTDLYRSIAFLPEPEAERAREALRACGAWESLHDAFTEGPRRFRALKAEHEAEAAAAAQKVVLLEEIIAELTHVPSPTSRLHWLGDMVWGPKHNGTNVSGNFETLGAAGQQEVLAAARTALHGATPSELPDAKASFSSNLLEEGEVFRQLCLLDGSEWLDDALIAKWLPTTLFATFSGTKGTDRVVERCYGVSPRATTAAVLADIRRTDGSFLRAHYVPGVLHRDAGFLQGLAGLAQQWARDPQSAPAALDAMSLLLRVAPEERATQETLAALRGDPNSAVRAEVHGTWLMHQPSVEAAQAAAAACVDEASTRLVTKGLAGVWRWRDGIGAWPIEVIAPVARALARHVPRVEVRRDSVGLVTEEERLQEIRDALVGRVFHHADRHPAAAAAREEITRISAYYATWAAGSAQHAALATAFASMRDLLAARTRPAPSIEKVVGVLRGTAAIVESARDLAEHLRWRMRRAFDQMDQSHFTLLYDSPTKDEYRPRHEEHLQQFVLRELETVRERSLPGLSVHREPSENATNEPDFIARVAGHEVPIEVKWSHNSDLRGGLTDQLARRYVREAPGTTRRTHGFYVVGWSGNAPDFEGQKRRLDEWAEEAQRTHQVTILPLVLDVRHPRARPR